MERKIPWRVQIFRLKIFHWILGWMDRKKDSPLDTSLFNLEHWKERDQRSFKNKKRLSKQNLIQTNIRCFLLSSWIDRRNENPFTCNILYDSSLSNTDLWRYKWHVLLYGSIHTLVFTSILTNSYCLFSSQFLE